MNSISQILEELSSNSSLFFPWLMYLGIFGLLVFLLYLLFSLSDKESRAGISFIISLLVIFVFIFFGELKPALYARLYKSTYQPKPAPAQTVIAKVEEAETIAPAPSPPKPKEIPKPKEKPKLQEKPKPITVPETPKPAPKPGLAIITEKPKEKPKPTPPPAPTPPPKPKEKPKPKPKTTPARTAPSGVVRMKISPTSAGTGKINITIRGPIVEVSKTHKPYAHLMIVLDGKYALVIQPTRYREQKKENEFGEEVLTSVTYFWEKIYAGFDNVPAGPHSVMIDVSLESPQVHKNKMVGSGNLNNDWNGFVQVSEGKTTTLVFGTKNWLTQELERIR